MMEVPHTQLRPAAPVVEIYGEDAAVFHSTMGVRGHESPRESRLVFFVSLCAALEPPLLYLCSGASKDSVQRESPQLEETHTSEGVMTPTDKEVATCVRVRFGIIGCF